MSADVNKKMMFIAIMFTMLSCGIVIYWTVTLDSRIAKGVQSELASREARIVEKWKPLAMRIESDIGSPHHEIKSIDDIFDVFRTTLGSLSSENDLIDKDDTVPSNRY